MNLRTRHAPADDTNDELLPPRFDDPQADLFVPTDLRPSYLEQQVWPAVRAQVDAEVDTITGDMLARAHFLHDELGATLDDIREVRISHGPFGSVSRIDTVGPHARALTPGEETTLRERRTVVFHRAELDRLRQLEAERARWRAAHTCHVGDCGGIDDQVVVLRRLRHEIANGYGGWTQVHDQVQAHPACAEAEWSQHLHELP